MQETRLDTRDEIKLLMDKAKVGYSRLADALGVNRDNLYYALNRSASELDTALYIKIISWFDKKGLTNSNNKENLLTRSLDLNRVFAEEFAGFNRKLKESLNDGNLDPIERKVMREYLGEMKKQLIKAITETLEQL